MPSSRVVPLDIAAAERAGLDFENFRRAFADAGYTTGALARFTEVARSGGRVDVAHAMRRTAGGTPLEILVRLFVLGRPVKRVEVERALPSVPIESLEAAGLLGNVDADNIRSSMTILPIDDLLITHDHGVEDDSSAGRKDVVMGIGLSSIAVARLSVRRQDKTALDLGTGSGYLALTASRHVESVTATDLNERALDFVAWNAKLNGVSNIETRHGNLYEPARDECFDLILGNPPFAISPESAYQFRDSGMPGDSLSEQVLVGAAERLTEGGVAVMTCSWRHESREDCHARPEGWIEGKGCDSWIICLDTRDPLSNAENWLTKSASSEEEYERRLDRWLDYYRAHGIRWISWGVAVLRKRKLGTPWRRRDALTLDWDAGSLAEEVEGILRAEDLLAELDEERLLDQRWRLSPRAAVDQQLRFKEGRWWLASARLRLIGGFAYPSNLDEYVHEILSGCDGSRPFREVLQDFANRRQLPDGQLLQASIPMARSMVSRGFLVLEQA